MLEPAHAALGPAQPSCHALFESTISIEAEVQSPVYASDREAISKLDKLLNEIKNDQTKLTNILISSYLALRLDQESTNVQAVALHFAADNLANRDRLIKFTTANENKYDPTDKKIQLAFPKEFADTPLAGFFFAHEFEHLLQDLKLGNQRFARLTRKGENRVKIEEAAMRAEFTFLLLIPTSVRQDFLKLWSKPESQIAGSLNLFLAAVEISLKTSKADDYVRAMWRLNRYRPEGF